MEYVTLGRTGPKVSVIGMGAMQASGKEFGQPYVEEQILDAVKSSKIHGVNLIDTAEEYGRGNSERVVGKALKEFGRDNFAIATKVFGQHLRFDELQKACAASIERLGVDAIDLYQVHWPDPWEQVPFKYTFKALEKLHDEGKIRAIGVSNFAVRDLDEARSLLSHADIVSNQVRYNLLQREIEEEVLPYCQKNAISILAWSPIGSGALSGKYSRETPPADHRKTHEVLFSPENIVQVEIVNSVLAQIASRREKTVPQVALNWLLTSTRAVVPIPGARNGPQAAENAGAAGWKLDESEVRALREAAEQTQLNYFP